MKLSLEHKIVLSTSFIGLCTAIFVGIAVSVVAAGLLVRSEFTWLYGGEGEVPAYTGQVKTLGISSGADEKGGIFLTPPPRSVEQGARMTVQSAVYPSAGLGGLGDLFGENSARYQRVVSNRLDAYLDRLQLSATFAIGLAGVLAALFAMLSVRWLTRGHVSGQSSPKPVFPEDIRPGYLQLSPMPRANTADDPIPEVGVFEQLWRMIPDPVIVFDAKGGVEILNRRAELMFGWDASEARALDIRKLLMPAKLITRDKWLERLRRPTASDDPVEAIGKCRNGLQIPLCIAIETFEYSGWSGYTTIVRDVVSQKQREAQLQLLIDTDVLTGAASRRCYLEESQRQFRAAQRYAKSLSVLVFDIDRFKAINDRYGHAVGDQILSHVVQACRNILRTPDLLGRLGGDEFAVTMPETDSAGAREVAQRMCGAIRELHHSGGGDTGLPAVSISIGIATLDMQVANFCDLLHRGDLCLCSAKRNGRNQFASKFRREPS